MKYAMSDGRAFTDYRSSSRAMQEIACKYGIYNTANVYDFIKSNPDKVMDDYYNHCPVCNERVQATYGIN